MVGVSLEGGLAVWDRGLGLYLRLVGLDLVRHGGGRVENRRAVQIYWTGLWSQIPEKEGTRARIYGRAKAEGPTA
jgi:hypothetical protein